MKTKKYVRTSPLLFRLNFDFIIPLTQVDPCLRYSIQSYFDIHVKLDLQTLNTE